MSFTKNDQVFPYKKRGISEQKVAHEIANILWTKFGEVSSAVKVIGKQTGANPRAIRNWYEGRNAPSAVHLIILARRVPEITEWVLDMLNICLPMPLESLHEVHRQKASKSDSKMKTYTAENCGINSVINANAAMKLNIRQLWFLEMIQKGERMRAGQVATAWHVSLRTAETDIAKLVRFKLVRFTGSRKSGHYEAIC